MHYGMRNIHNVSNHDNHKIVQNLINICFRSTHPVPIRIFTEIHN